MRRTLLQLNVSTSRLFSSTTRLRDTVDLAYTRHDPPPNNNTPSSSSSSSHPPILFMHGLFGSQRNNRTMSKILARDLSRPVYTLDLRNHGDSPHSPTHTYTAMAEDVENWIDQQGLLGTTRGVKQKPVLIGHSMGAKVAMTLALRRPGSYGGVVPVDNAPLDAALKGDFGMYVNAMREIEEAVKRGEVGRQREADEILQKYEGDLGIRQFLLTNFVKVKTPVEEGKGEGAMKSEMRWRIPLQTLAKSLPDMADFPFRDPESVRFEGPVLVVRGVKSHYVSDESLPLIGKFFPKFEVLDCDAGHWVIAEKPEEFRRGVVEWVRRVVDGDGEER